MLMFCRYLLKSFFVFLLLPRTYHTERSLRVQHVWTRWYNDLTLLYPRCRSETMTVKRKTKKRKTRGKTKRRKKTRKNPNKTCVVIPNLPKKPMLCIYINRTFSNRKTVILLNFFLIMNIRGLFCVILVFKNMF